jgi:hypothetical protein
VHFQAAFISNYDLHLTLETMLRNRPRPLLAQPLQVLAATNREVAHLHWQRDEVLENEQTSAIAEVDLDEDDADLIEDNFQED